MRVSRTRRLNAKNARMDVRYKKENVLALFLRLAERSGE